MVRAHPPTSTVRARHGPRQVNRSHQGQAGLSAPPGTERSHRFLSVHRSCCGARSGAQRRPPRRQGAHKCRRQTKPSLRLPFHYRFCPLNPESCACALTVKLRGRTATPDARRGRTLSPGARGAKPLTHHGPLQRLLGGACTGSTLFAKREGLGNGGIDGSTVGPRSWRPRILLPVYRRSA